MTLTVILLYSILGFTVLFILFILVLLLFTKSNEAPPSIQNEPQRKVNSNYLNNQNIVRNRNNHMYIQQQNFSYQVKHANYQSFNNKIQNHNSRVNYNNSIQQHHNQLKQNQQRTNTHNNFTNHNYVNQVKYAVYYKKMTE